MTETTWLRSTQPRTMLNYLEVYHNVARTRAGRRKLRLLGCATARSLWNDFEEKYGNIVNVAESYADGRIQKDEVASWKAGLQREAFWGRGGHEAEMIVDLSPQRATAMLQDYRSDDIRTRQSDLVREVFGNPFRPPVLRPTWLDWNERAVVRLAEAIYEERAFDHLTILADALEDAGCTDADILGHCRGPGPHVRGCWVVDLLLGKS
jgi:hypothetical protein